MSGIPARTVVTRRCAQFMVLVLTLCTLVACGRVESESGLSQSQERYLVTIGMIGEDEHVRFFTSGGMSFEEAGTFFTDVRVGSYWLPGEADESLTWAYLKDVTGLDLTVQGDSWTEADHITVTRVKGKDLKIPVPSSDEKFSTRFHQALTEQWKRVRAEG